MGKPDLWMPLYVADYLADTQHLTTAHHGAYLLLLMASWMRGGRLPDDDEQLASVCRLDRKSWAKARPVLGEFFSQQDGYWVQKRLAEEYEHAKQISEKNRENGKLGGRPRKPDETERLSQTEPNGGAKGEANRKPDETPSPPQLQTTKPKVKNTVGQVPDDAREILLYLNSQAVRSFPPVPANIDLIAARLRDGATADQCKQVIDRKVAEWRGDAEMSKYMRPATLFNRTKFANYVGELGAPICRKGVPDYSAAIANLTDGV